VSSGTAVRPHGPGVWWVTGWAEARRVLDDADGFRGPHLSEFVPGVSRSFFLAADSGDEQSAAAARRVLVAYFAPARLRELRERALRPICATLLATIGRRADCDLAEAYVRPFHRRVSYHLAGVDPRAGAELVGMLRVVQELVGQHGHDDSAAALYEHVARRVLRFAHDGQLAPSGLPGFATREGLVTPRQAAQLCIPILEMAASDHSPALTFEALRAAARLDEAGQAGLRDPQALRSMVVEAAGRLPDLVATRVVERDTTLGGCPLHRGDRVLLDLSRANRDVAERTARNGVRDQHLAFGRGAHVCLGRELALQLPVVALGELLQHGTVTATDPLTLRPFPEIERDTPC
jgi:cytochrome P450